MKNIQQPSVFRSDGYFGILSQSLFFLNYVFRKSILALLTSWVLFSCSSEPESLSKSKAVKVINKCVKHGKANIELFQYGSIDFTSYTFSKYRMNYKNLERLGLITISERENNHFVSLTYKGRSMMMTEDDAFNEGISLQHQNLKFSQRNKTAAYVITSILEAKEIDRIDEFLGTSIVTAFMARKDKTPFYFLENRMYSDNTRFKRQFMLPRNQKNGRLLVCEEAGHWSFLW